MKVELWYGDGFTGRTYNLLLEGDERYIKLQHGLGGPNDEAEARKKAKQILQEKGIDVDITNIPFKWNGHL